jgi:hypothetical protein
MKFLVDCDFDTKMYTVFNLLFIIIFFFQNNHNSRKQTIIFNSRFLVNYE